MNKIIIACLFIMFFKLTYSQDLPIDTASGKILYTEVVKVDSISKEKSYSKTKEWFALNFKSANDEIQLDDKENFTIIGKGAIKVTLMSFDAGFVRFTIKVQAKDNKYKYEISDLVHDSKTAKRPEMEGGNLENIKPDCGGLSMTKGQWNDIKTQADKQVQILIQSLKTKISTNKTESDW
jgi:hypothetical protein